MVCTERKLRTGCLLVLFVPALWILLPMISWRNLDGGALIRGYSAPQHPSPSPTTDTHKYLPTIAPDRTTTVHPPTTSHKHLNASTTMIQTFRFEGGHKYSFLKLKPNCDKWSGLKTRLPSGEWIYRVVCCMSV